ncbi:MAG: 16S rRNA (cytosine(1402)-N(4))-methyltransferase RsmH [Candidatus Andersenbacteria bacterium]|nr:16S rRNA (cytosine(1402)-N(4))-methyltransferase RsmH [Candidatus Andersenbacteria bacterium]
MTHTPVLVHAVLKLFDPRPGSRLLDATLGTGGHTRAFLAAAPQSEIVALDADHAALEQARQELEPSAGRVTYIHANFAHLKDSVIGGGILPPLFTHILFDLGLGSHQLADSERGYSFHTSGPLRMRYGLPALVPAQLPLLNWLERRLGHQPEVADLIARLTAEQLTELIRHYGEERYARSIAQAIKQPPPLRDAAALAERIVLSVPPRARHTRLHPATRTFLALRLAVNRELEALQCALPQAVSLLEPQGKVAVISFHSLEDRLVKHYFRQAQVAGLVTILTKKPLRPARREVTANPRARSAKLRAAVKT